MHLKGVDYQGNINRARFCAKIDYVRSEIAFYVLDVTDVINVADVTDINNVVFRGCGEGHFL